MKKRYYFWVDEETEWDIAALLGDISRPMRGAYIKDALRLGIDPERDKDLCQMLPDLMKPYCRYELVKAALREWLKSQTGNRKDSATKATFPFDSEMG